MDAKDLRQLARCIKALAKKVERGEYRVAGTTCLDMKVDLDRQKADEYSSAPAYDMIGVHVDLLLNRSGGSDDTTS